MKRTLKNVFNPSFVLNRIPVKLRIEYIKRATMRPNTDIENLIQID